MDNYSFFHCPVYFLRHPSYKASKTTMAPETPTRKRPEPGKHFCLLALGLLVVLIVMVFLIHRNSVAPVGANPPANTYQRN